MGGRGIPVNVKNGVMAPRKPKPRVLLDVSPRTVRCPTCLVQPTEDCVTVDGKACGSHFHRPRSRMAARASNQKRGIA